MKAEIYIKYKLKMVFKFITVIPVSAWNSFYFFALTLKLTFNFHLTERNKKMCLTEIKKGQTVSVVEISDEEIRTQFIRFGISEGSELKCLEKIPFGPFMLRHKNQELAIGRGVARNITVNGGVK